jgi:hemoglobin
MGRENIFRMCEDFYFALGKTDIRPMFPEDLREASHKLAAYLVFRLGGPPLYQELHGPPRLRARHLSFQIDERSRRTWLAAFQTILAEADQKYGFPKEHRESFWRFLEAFSGWMVNTKQPGDLT